jgi:beta-lactamase regulating signal transducer with metallopeptidase domain
MTPSPMTEVLFVVFAGFVAAWVLSYLLHSTVVCLAAAVITRVLSLGPVDIARVWRFVLLAPFVSATIAAIGLSQAMPLTIDVSQYVPQVLVDWRVGMLSLVPIVLVPFMLVAAFLEGRALLSHVFGDRRPAPVALQQEVTSLATSAGCRNPRVTVSHAAAVPAAIGMSEICVPAALSRVAPCDERQALIAHEMGHLQRRDPLWFLVVGSLVRMTPFQPLNRFALARLRASCEDAADDLAVEVTGDPVALARGLARVATMLVVLPAGAAASGSPVVARVARLLDGSRTRPMAWRRSTSLVVSAVALAALVWLAPGVSANAEAVADRLSWLGASKEEPNAKMLEVRRISRAWRDAINRAF